MDIHDEDGLSGAAELLIRSELVEIDTDALDQEAATISETILKYTKLCAQAHKDWLDAKNVVEVVKAKLILRINKFPGEYGLTDKPTQSVINACATVDPKHQRMIRRMHEARKRLDTLKGAVKSLDSKKKQIENLDSLHRTGFYSEPKDRRAEHAQQRRETMQSTVRKGLKKRRGI